MGKHEVSYERIERDLYPTPSWVTEALIPHLPPIAGKLIWEPAAGHGDIVKVLRAAGARVIASDIEQRDFPLHRIRDFTAPLPADGVWPDGIMTNPPFGFRNKLAVKFIELALERVNDFAAFLLPSDFDCAVSRRHLFADCPQFATKVVLTRRIVWFEGPNAAPKENHCWMVWRRAHVGPPTIAYGPQPSSDGKTVQLVNAAV